MRTLVIILVLALICLCVTVLSIYRDNRRINLWRENLKIGHKVRFYDGEQSCHGVVTRVYGDQVFVKDIITGYSHVFFRSELYF